MDAADVIQGKYDWYKQNIAPKTTQLLDEVFSDDNTAEAVASSRDTAQSSFGQGLTARSDFQRSYGINLSPEEKAIQARKDQIHGAISSANAANSTRLAYRDMDMNTGLQLSRLGRGLSTTATQGLVYADQQKTNRDIMNENAKQQQMASTLSTGASFGAGIGLVASFL